MDGILPETFVRGVIDSSVATINSFDQCNDTNRIGPEWDDTSPGSPTPADSDRKRLPDQFRYCL